MAAFVNEPYSVQLTATGGSAPYKFFLLSGALPPGLTLTTGGLLSGTPTILGTYEFTVNAIDGHNGYGERDYALEVSAGNTLVATLLALNPSSLWQMDEASGDLLDTGSSSFPLIMASGGNENHQLPGLGEGPPRVYGAWNVTNFNYGTPISKNVEGYDMSAWTSGGIGVFGLVATHIVSQYVFAHYADSGTATYIAIFVEADGTIHGIARSSTFQIELESAAGAYTFGDRAFFFFHFDGVLPKLYLDGVDVTLSRAYSGAGIGDTSTLADCVAGAGATGAGSHFHVGNNSSGGQVNTVQGAVMSVPHVFYNTVLTDAEVLSIANAAWGSGHNDYQEYMLEKVGRAKLYAPILTPYGASISLTPVLTETESTQGNPRFQAGTVAAVEDDAVLVATEYDKKQWDLTGSDDDAYLRNNGGGQQVPLVETADDGLIGTIGLTLTWVETDGAGAPNNIVFDYSNNTTQDRIRMWIAAGAGSEGRLTFQVTSGGVVVYEAWTDETIIVGLTSTITVVKPVASGSGYDFYINGQPETFTEDINTNDTLWLGDCFKSISGFNTWFGGLTDWDDVAHEAFYLETAWSAADALEHHAAQYGSFPS